VLIQLAQGVGKATSRVQTSANEDPQSLLAIALVIIEKWET
jgi:hypothetical protein